MKKIIFALLITLLVLPGCNRRQKAAQAETEGSKPVIDTSAVARIDSLLETYVDNGQLGGVSALIYEKGKEVYFNAFGYSDREKGRPMDRNTIVQIFSMTKPITGVALMTLYEEGAFELDEPLSKYAPEFENMQVYTGVGTDGKMLLEPANRPISIRDITRHTAGFPNRPDIPGLGEMLVKAEPMNRENTLAQMAAKFGALPLWFQPGAQWEYGPCVDVQAYLVEKLSGEPFDKYVREHVLDPLGMTETRYLVPQEDRDRFSAMYRIVDDSLTQVPDDLAKSDYLQDWPLKRGGSGLTSTIDNYMTFARMLLNSGTLDKVTILKPETVRLMATNHLPDSVKERSWLPSKGQVGFGIDFAVRVRPPADAEENFGEVGEFYWDGAASTLFWVDPVNDLTAVLFVQLFPYDPIRLHKNFRDAVYGGYAQPNATP
jgi:CubicO group peptidase (beta-lactamase class C family)